MKESVLRSSSNYDSDIICEDELCDGDVNQGLNHILENLGLKEGEKIF